ncbi:MAG: glutaredoxin family protein [Burkholderiales bacterium]|nr:glutaredoxin family protein [Burkholderiales bacterium]
MREALEALGRLERFELAVLDIDDDPALQARFGRDVPVLAHGDREIARHRLDAAIVRAYLAGIG